MDTTLIFIIGIAVAVILIIIILVVLFSKPKGGRKESAVRYNEPPASSQIPRPESRRMGLIPSIVIAIIFVVIIIAITYYFQNCRIVIINP